MSFNGRYSAKNFGARVKEIAEKTERNIDEVLDQSIRELWTDIVEETPVGDPSKWRYPPPPGYVPGNAKANWNPSVNAPDDSLTNSKEPANYKIDSIMGRVSGNIIYFTNAVPYMYRLEHDGWAYSQDAGWIYRAVRSYQATLTKTVRNLRN